jgi:23S rRNA (cytosine1962-C5)-methyltransferase
VSSDLCADLTAAWGQRLPLFAQMAAENTNAYRVFHGSTEGQPGLTLDRYGEVLLVQSFHQPLSDGALQELAAFYSQQSPGLKLVYNDRSQSSSRVGNWLRRAEQDEAELPRVIQELGVNYRFAARHPGQDPWLFLDLRAGRRRVMQLAPGRSVLNLFAYTCGVGMAAAFAGAREVVNVDFAQSGLAVGQQSAALNSVGVEQVYLKTDVFSALRQWSGLGQPQMVRGKRLPEFTKLAPRQFELVFLDPPRLARSPFGVVDLVRDYPALFKPALLATQEGGTLICCNNVAQVGREEWLDQLERSAKKCGRPLQNSAWIEPEGDFPSPDGQPPLKMVELRV